MKVVKNHVSCSPHHIHNVLLLQKPLQDMKVVFSGVHDVGLENLIASLGGKVSSAISALTTVLAVEDLSKTTSGSTKVRKALEYGVKVQSYYDFRTEVWAVRDKVNKV